MNVSTSLNQLQPHEHQMRTVYDLDKLAELLLSVYSEGGIRAWQPIVAAANDDGSFRLIHGHRRWLALIFGAALPDWLARQKADGQPVDQVTVETGRTFLTQMVEHFDNLLSAGQALLKRYGNRPVDVVLYEGDTTDELYALLGGNFGAEAPDMLGLAIGFAGAVAAGASPAQIAARIGKPVQFVQHHLALQALPQPLQKAIATGVLPLSVAAKLQQISGDAKRAGLSAFVLANIEGDRSHLSAGDIAHLAKALDKWPGIQLPMLFDHQTQRNLARAVGRLWGQVLEAHPAATWAAAASLMHQGLHEEPWKTPAKLTAFFQLFGGDIYYDNASGQIRFEQLLAHLLPEVGCAGCPIKALPAGTTLRFDLAPAGGVMGMPCRFGEPAERCLHGFAADDSIDIRVQPIWADLPGVTATANGPRITSLADLQTAWQARAQLEAEEDAAAVAEETGAVTSNNGQPAVSQPPAGGVSADAVGASGNSDDAAAATGPIARMRAQIADFMAHHTTLAVDHPVATRCAGCQHRLAKSPTKDPEVPHCAWAGRLRTVQFLQLQPAEAGQPVIPVCRQYAPTASWAELIPAHPAPPGLPRDWLVAQTLELAQQASSRLGSDRYPFEFLTGRPMKGSESHASWFAEQLKARQGDLADAQLFTLFLWSHAQWSRERQNAALPLGKDGLQFGRYQESRWPENREGDAT
ncbi:MAG: ParB N-terminal domain-containing protein [Anaerolineales bacterium]|nr:ParB N-terminal domain-containing protein [Anaerolineales bacterium]